MADVLVASTLRIILACVNKYKDFGAYKEECETFQQSLSNVADVLKDIQTSLRPKSSLTGSHTSHSSTSTSSTTTSTMGSGTNTTLQRPMELLQAAAKDGGHVLDRCHATRKLLVFVFSRELMGMLTKAKANVEEAMKLLQMSSIKIQVSTRRLMGDVSERMEELDKKIDAVNMGKNDVADMVRAELKQHRESHNVSVVAEAVSETLLQMGIVSSPQDCVEQLVELQKEAESLRNAKVAIDQDLLEAVRFFTAPPATENAGGAPVRPLSSSETSMIAATVQDLLVCPISKEIMRDPVTVVASSITYDRKFLCKSLLEYPDLDPASGLRYDQPLLYTPNLTVRSLITAQYGESYYQKYDDEEFMAKYQAIWEKRRQSVADLEDPSPGGTLEQLHWAVAASTQDSSGVAYDEEPDEPAKQRCWRLRHNRKLMAGSALGALVIVIIIIVAVAVTKSKSAAQQPSPSSSASRAGVPMNASSQPTPSPSTSSGGGAANVPQSTSPPSSSGTVQVSSPPTPPSSSSGGSSSPPTQSPNPPPSSAAPVSAPSGSSNLTSLFRSKLPAKTIASLQNTNSPQYRAYEWETQQDQIPATEEAGNEAAMLQRMIQRFALATLFNSMNAPDGWVNSTLNECFWGSYVSPVSCSGSRLALSYSNFLGGSFPPEVGLLTNLESIHLRLTGLAFSIPTEVGQLSFLTNLDLGFNKLTSSIPTELGDLTHLQQLILSSNTLSSSIPTEFGKLTELKTLLLESNWLTSTIPTELGQLSSLFSMNLAGNNNLNGTVPSALCSNYDIGITCDCQHVSCPCAYLRCQCG